MLLIPEAVPMVTLASYPNTNVVSTQASKQASVTVCAIIFYFKILSHHTSFQAGRRSKPSLQRKPLTRMHVLRFMHVDMPVFPFIHKGLSKETAKVLFKKGYEACEAAAAGSSGNQGDSPHACKCDVPVPGDNAEAGRRKRLAVAFKVKPNFAPYDDDITYDFATPVLNTHLHLPADVYVVLVKMSA